MEPAALVLLLSIDNVRLAGALGLLETDRRQWWRLAMAMAAVEAGFPLLGVLAGGALPAEATSLDLIGPLVLLAAAAIALAGALAARTVRVRGLLFALPALFALDNLVAGTALGPSTAWAVGAISGAVSLVAMVVVGRLGERLRERRAWAPAALALAVGASAPGLP